MGILITARFLFTVALLTLGSPTAQETDSWDK